MLIELYKFTLDRFGNATMLTTLHLDPQHHGVHGVLTMLVTYNSRALPTPSNDEAFHDPADGN